MNLKNRILNSAIQLYMKYGIKSVSMDDISRELGMSKKTIYTCILNKADLVKQALKTVLDTEQEEIKLIRDNSANAIEEMISMAKYITQFLRKMKPSLTFDLQKYYPETWNILNTEHLNFIKNTIKSNIERGKEEELYRKDLNPIIISEIYVNNSRLITNEDVFHLKDYNKADLYTEQIYYHLHGIVNTKGRAQLKKNLKVLNQ